MPFPVDNVAQSQEAVRKAHLRHAADPRVANRFSLAFQAWRKDYEAKAALHDQNPTFAAKLLPAVVGTTSKALGFLLIPAGVRSVVDEAAPNTVSVSVEVAATLTVAVTTPSGAKLSPAVTATPTRQSFLFKALVDGLYQVDLYANGTRLTTVFVPVQRSRFFDFRQLSRQLAYDFSLAQDPAAPDAYSEMLAVLYGCDAAAATGQTALFQQLAAVAAQLEKAPTPTALYPHA